MSMLPSAALDSAGDVPTILNRKIRDRERALVGIFVGAALMVGAFAGVASYQALAFAAGVYLILLAAWTLPLTWLGPVLAALIPFQFYFTVPATSLTLRVAVLFLVAGAVRVIVDRPPSAVRGQPSAVAQFAFLLPATLFLLVTLIAALGAQDRYAAMKGIYDWLVVLLTAITVAGLAPAAATARRTLAVLIVGGVAEALLGLLQYVLGLTAVLDLLRLPFSGLLYQPNLLRDRLQDLSFNWVAFDRALPFGTFINGIDYAVFLAAILCLIIALVIAGPSQNVISRERSDREISSFEPKTEISRSARNDIQAFREAPIALERPSAVGGRQWTIALMAGAAPIAVALLLTFKGSGFLALMGGMAAIALASLARPSRRTVAIGLLVVIGALVVALPFSDLIGQRALFLLQREQGSAGSVGRLQTWSSLLGFVAQRPLFGYGLYNAIALIEPQWTLRDGAPGFVFSTPESAYVSALVETGMVGFIALMGWLSAAVISGYRRARAAKYGTLQLGMVAALVALLFGNFTVSGLTTDQNGMLLGMLIGMIYGSQHDD